MRHRGQMVTLLAAFVAIGCSDAPKSTTKAFQPVPFKDDAQTNNQPPVSPSELAFVDAEGKPIDVKKYRGQKNVVLVVTRGISGYVCPYCTTQTSSLAANHEQFAKRNAEVLVVFPGPTEQLPEFQKAISMPAGKTTLPFPLLLDKQLQAIDRLGIRGDLAKPSTFILDKEGQLRFAYVGSSDSDRPSVKAMLDQLDKIAKD